MSLHLNELGFPFIQGCAVVTQLAKAFATQTVGWVFESRLRQFYSKSLKHEVTAPLVNALQPVWVSTVFGDDHYKRIFRATVRYNGSLKNPHCSMAIIDICQNLQLFTGNGHVSIWVKNPWVGRKTPNKQKINIDMVCD